jgi:aspartokinase
VVAQRKIALVSTAGAGSLEPLLVSAARLGLALGDLAVDASGVRAWLPLTNVPDFTEARAGLEAAGIAGLCIDEPLGLVSLVGVEVGSRPELCARAIALLPASPLFCASSSLRISAVVKESELEPAARRWHAELVQSAT